MACSDHHHPFLFSPDGAKQGVTNSNIYMVFYRWHLWEQSIGREKLEITSNFRWETQFHWTLKRCSCILMWILPDLKSWLYVRVNCLGHLNCSIWLEWVFDANKLFLVSLSHRWREQRNLGSILGRCVYYFFIVMCLWNTH